jgi:hypothetical protein
MAKAKKRAAKKRPARPRAKTKVVRARAKTKVVRSQAKKKLPLVGSVEGQFTDWSGTTLQTGAFGSVQVGGPPVMPFPTPPATPPPGQRAVGFSFQPSVGHKNALPEVTLRTTGPFGLWTGVNVAQTSKLVRLPLGGDAYGFCYIFFQPKRLGKLRGSLTVSTKRVTLTGTFRNNGAFALHGVSTP